MLAGELAKQMENKHSDSAEVLLSAGEMLLAHGELERAKLILLPATKAGAGPRAPRLLGEILLRQGDAVRAVRALRGAIKMGASDRDCRRWYDAALAYVPMQNTDGKDAVERAVTSAMTTGDPMPPALEEPDIESQPVPKREEEQIIDEVSQIDEGQIEDAESVTTLHKVPPPLPRVGAAKIPPPRLPQKKGPSSFPPMFDQPPPAVAAAEAQVARLQGKDDATAIMSMDELAVLAEIEAAKVAAEGAAVAGAAVTGAGVAGAKKAKVRASTTMPCADVPEDLADEAKKKAVPPPPEKMFPDPISVGGVDLGPAPVPPPPPEEGNDIVAPDSVVPISVPGLELDHKIADPQTNDDPFMARLRNEGLSLTDGGGLAKDAGRPPKLRSTRSASTDADAKAEDEFQRLAKGEASPPSRRPKSSRPPGSRRKSKANWASRLVAAAAVVVLLLIAAIRFGQLPALAAMLPPWMSGQAPVDDAAPTEPAVAQGDPATSPAQDPAPTDPQATPAKAAPAETAPAAEPGSSVVANATAAPTATPEAAPKSAPKTSPAPAPVAVRPKPVAARPRPKPTPAPEPKKAKPKPRPRGSDGVDEPVWLGDPELND